MAETNFSLWNPTATNQENDSTYQGDSQRTGGAINGQAFDDVLANKLLYQATIMVRALALMLVAKGYSPVDGTTPFTADTSTNTAATALATVLANILTVADAVATFGSTGYAGHIKFGGAFGGLLLQWGAASGSSSGIIVTYPVAYSSGAIPIVIPSASGVTSFYAGDNNETQFEIFFAGESSASFFWFAIGT
jgi:hypothetical protein